MATRTRTLGTYFNGRASPEQRSFNRLPFPQVGYAWTNWGLFPSQYYYASRPESMTDTNDSPGAIHNCNHSKYSYKGDIGVEVLLCSDAPSGGGYTLRSEAKVRSPICIVLHESASHISGGLTGLKALCIARVPAYANAEVQGFIALAEAREIVDSSAVKASLGLAQYLAAAYRGLRRGNLGRTLSRDGKRALEALTGKVSDVKSVASTALDALRTANSLDMEWKYCWKPMVSTIKDANKAIETLSTLRQKLLDGVRVYGRAVDVRTSNWSQSRICTTDGAVDFPSWQCQGTKVTKTVGVASIVRALQPSSSMYDVDWFNSLDVVMEVNGLNPSLKSLWQLSNLTFITDWFWNVSSLLESVESLAMPVGTSFTSHSGIYSEKSETTITGSATAAPKAGQSYTSRGTLVYKTYNRSLDPLTGGPAIYIPPLKLPTKAAQWWSMSQIAFQRLTGKHR